MDRMDYLIRDSFFAGVAEGTIGTERIIKMLNVVNDQLVIEAKGIYSVEKFLIARRLMYWQVYFHKTVIAAENLLVQVLKRAKSLASQGLDLYTTPSLGYFLDNDFSHENIDIYCDEILENFTNLDDDDIMVSAKAWMHHSDPVLSLLSANLIRRTLPRVRISDTPFEDLKIAELKKSATDTFNLSESDAGYLVFTGLISNMAYNEKADTIKILYNTGEMKDLSEASDIFHLQKLMETKKKYFLCYPKVLGF
jgi:HD superfamily phosphohydrolase